MIDIIKIKDVSERIQAISKSRPVMRLFEESNGFLLRYGQTTDIEPALSVKFPYDDAFNADDSILRKFIHDTTPNKVRLQLDVEKFTEKQKTLINLLHLAVDSYQWDEVDNLNSKLKWVSKELKGLRITLGNVE